MRSGSRQKLIWVANSYINTHRPEFPGTGIPISGFEFFITAHTYKLFALSIIPHSREFYPRG